MSSSQQIPNAIWPAGHNLPLTRDEVGPTLPPGLSEFDLKRCRMRKWLLFGLLAGLAVTSGCATVTKTPAENAAAWRQNIEHDARQIGDDWNLIWLTDHQGRLTKWHTR